MQDTPPVLYLIGGPNGSGKTTFAKEYLPNTAKCLKFLNSDEIARGLEPLAPANGQIQAGKILLANLKQNINQGRTFALESTLSGKTYLKYLQQAKDKGYKIVLHFLWIPSAEMSLSRVKQRVSEGGHHVSEEDVLRRYPRIMENIYEAYLPLADEWYFWDATSLSLTLIEQSKGTSIAQLKKTIANKGDADLLLEEKYISHHAQAAQDAALRSAIELLELKQKLGHNFVLEKGGKVQVIPAKDFSL